MHYFVCALYEEAAPFITYYQLQKDTSLSKFQIFRNEDTVLVLTKSGCLNCSIGVTYLLSHDKPSEQDIIINIGICATTDPSLPLGTPYLIYKITDTFCEYTYYPDILYQHPFEEQQVRTVGKPQNTCTSGNEHGLIDMEAAGFYAAASHFMQPHQIITIKLVSDSCNSSSVKPQHISQYIKQVIPYLHNWLEQLDYVQESAAGLSYTEEELALLTSQLKLSVTMQHDLEQLLRYYTLENGDTRSLIELLFKDSLQIKTKAEGKIYFDKLKQTIIS